jgi:predicted enzyme related to lactoylglutathione lyase
VPESNPHGRFVWHELMTTDPEAAIKFYPGVTGWGVLPFEQDPSYRMWTVQGMPIGGVLPLSDEAKSMGAHPYWLPYIGTADLDGSTAHATRLGATVVVRPTTIIPGRFSVLRDPQGATFALFESSREMPMPGREGDAAVGEFSWHELATTDGDAAWAFYRALCDWKPTTAMDMGPDGKYQMFGRNGVELGGIYNRKAGADGRPQWLCYVRVASTDRAVSTTKSQGGGVVSGPMQVPGGNYIASLHDAHGVAFAVHEEREHVAPAAKPKAKAKAKAKAKVKAKAKPKKKAKAAPKAKKKSKPAAKKKPKPKKTVKARAKSRPKPKKKARAKK